MRAILIHHGLSPHADSWVRHCEAVCERWQVSLVVERVTLADNGTGIEAHARESALPVHSHRRYCWRSAAARSTLTISVKTFLLALKRGSG